MASAKYGGAPGQIPQGAILGLGNPLLDMLAHVPKSFADEYNITEPACLAEGKQTEVYGALGDKVELVAGGATQNSIRVAQWMGRSPGATGFLGAVGKDKNAVQLRASCESSGVAAHYYESETSPTGLCAALIVEKERFLCTKLDACNEYKHEHTLKPEIQKVIDQAKIYYSAGFFVTVPEGPQSMLHIAEHACANNKVYSLNLSAEFLLMVPPFLATIEKLIPYCDYVFGNEVESAKFGEVKGWGSDLETIALKLSALPKQNGCRGRTVVFTNGGEPTIIARDGKVFRYAVPALAKELLVDTNGAGDAFVGGFLARLGADEPIEECVRAGHYAARVVIQNSGATFPAQPDV